MGVMLHSKESGWTESVHAASSPRVKRRSGFLGTGVMKNQRFRLTH